MSDFDARKVLLQALFGKAIRDIQATDDGHLIVHVASIDEDSNIASEETLLAIKALLDENHAGLIILPGEETLVAGVPQDVITQSLSAGLRIHGFTATSHRYTRFEFIVGGITRITAYVTSDAPLADIRLPVPIELTAASTVAVRAENLSDQGSTNAHASLLVSP